MIVKPSRYTVATQTARTAVQATSPTLECYVLSNIQAVKFDLPIFHFQYLSIIQVKSEHHLRNMDKISRNSNVKFQTRQLF
jgi:hypothetical protein